MGNNQMKRNSSFLTQGSRENDALLVSRHTTAPQRAVAASTAAGTSHYVVSRTKISEDYKILLLGTGEGGKSTIFKQILHMYHRQQNPDNCGFCSGFGYYDMNFGPKSGFHGGSEPNGAGDSLFSSVEYRRGFTHIIRRNALSAMAALCMGTQEHFSLQIQDQQALSRIQAEREASLDHENWKLTPEIAEVIAKLWREEEALRVAYHRRHELESFFESAQYFFDDIFRLADPGYVPTVLDLMKMRVKTTGIVEQKITFIDVERTKHKPSKQQAQSNYGSQASQGTAAAAARSGNSAADTAAYQISEIRRKKSLTVVLSGSQRPERKKWAAMWQSGGVSAVIFVVALSEYAQVLYEDGRTNRLEESLALFEELMHAPQLQGIPFYLFFNKHDVFCERISNFDLRTCPSFANSLPQQLWLDESKQYNVFIPALLSQRQPQILSETRRSMNPHVDKQAQAKFDAVVNRVDRRRKASHRDRKPAAAVATAAVATGEGEGEETRQGKAGSALALENFSDQNLWFLDLPTDNILLICMFLESTDLLDLERVCRELHTVVATDYLWRSLTLSYCPEIVDSTVLKVYKSSRYFERLQSRQFEAMVAAAGGSGEATPSPLSAGLMDLSTPTTPGNGHIEIPIPMSPWRYYYYAAEHFVQQNVNYIMQQFVKLVPRDREVKSFVTTAVDGKSLKPVMDTVMHEVLFLRSGFMSTRTERSLGAGSNSAFHHSKSNHRTYTKRI